MRYLLLLIVTIFCFSCGDDEPTVDEQIQGYITDNNLDPLVTSPDTLYYVITDEGTGLQPNLSHTITIAYSGYYTDGEVFDSSTNASFPLTDLIEGWQIGIPLIKKGGTIKLIIPPNLAYGPNPQNGIRKNAVLVFDIELIDFF